MSVLWALSGRQFGECPTNVRPCPEGERRDYYARYYPYPYVVEWIGDGWANLGCGCLARCQHTGPGAVHLPGPATKVTRVTVAGTVLDTTQYVLEGGVLYRRGDSMRWPHQNLSRPLGEANTWSVEYLRGIPAPAGTGKLVALLAKEFLAACSGEKCRLPRSVTNVIRNGVSYERVQQAVYDAGKVGLPEVDLWLSAVNPRHLMAAPSVT